MKKIFTFIAAALFAGSMMAGEVLNTNFADGQGEWTINDVTLPEGATYVWQCDQNYGQMKASAYFSSANHASESWLISPVFDLSEAASASLTFNQALNYGVSSALSVKAKAGEGEWTDLEVDAWPAGTSWTFMDSHADLSDFAGKAAVQIAFVYTSTDEKAGTWEIKTVVVADEPAPVVIPADVTFLPADFEGQGQAATLETPGGEVSATKEGVTVSANDAYGHNLALRVYASNEDLGVVSTFSISSADKTIDKIKFQFYSTYTGDLETEYVVNAKEWSVESMAKQARIEKIEIFFGEEEQGIENVVLTEKASKVMVDGVLYIVRDGKMFDVRGAQVR